MNRRLFWKIFLPFWVAQALLLGVQHQLEASVQPELLVDVVEVDLHGPLRDRHPLGNDPVAQALRDHGFTEVVEAPAKKARKSAD